jgi:metallo-beta-lactamase family protein
MKIEFCGAAREVTGSCHLIHLRNGKKILLDCGLYQGNDKKMKDFNENFPFNPEEIDVLILSHAHIDHSGRIPYLVKKGFRGNIYATHATTNLCSIMLLDSAHIQEADADFNNKKLLVKGRSKDLIEPLYTKEDVPPAMEAFVSLPYDRWIPIDENILLQFKDAGHILGSATITLQIKEKGLLTTLGYTGDIGRPDRPILRDPKPMPLVDYLIMESTYGNRNHETKSLEQEHLLEIIRKTCIENKGKLIIPAFSIGRTQEIVYIMNQMYNEGVLPKIPIYVDSPLAIDATEIYGSHPECYDEELSSYILQDANPFGFKTLTYIREVKDSKKLNASKEPCIIISAAGMMTAGRIRHHMYNNLENPNNTFLMLGFCAPGTAGDLLINGIKEIKLFGETKQVRATIAYLPGFSAHGDKEEMKQFIANQKKVRKIFLVHGNYEAQLAFKKELIETGFNTVVIPELMSIHEIEHVE